LPHRPIDRKAQAFRLSRNLVSPTPIHVITALFSPPTLAPRGQPTVTEKVMAGIRAMLITGALAPGSRIDQIARLAIDILRFRARVLHHPA